MLFRLEVSNMERVDELCPACLTPALWKINLVSISDKGVTPTGHCRYCDRCKDHR